MAQHLKPRSTTVPLYQGDDMDRLADLKRAVLVAERQAEVDQKESGAQRFGDDDPAEGSREVKAKRAEFDAFVDEAAERALFVELRSIGSRRFRDLVLEHAPRMVDSEPDEAGKTTKIQHPEDQGYSVNTETFPRALLCYRSGDYMTIAAPEFGSISDVGAFVDDELSEGDVEQLWVAAYLLNRNPSADPSQHRYSGTSLSTDET